MANIEKIQGDDILRILKGLQQDKTLLKMQLPDGDFERLTFIIDIRKRKRIQYILIDYPEGFLEATEGLADWRIRFEFTGRDGIMYVFETEGGEYFQGMIWIKLPEVIDRYQRRKLFRLEAPPRTRLFFQLNDNRYELLAINVSLGGSLGALVRMNRTKEKDLENYNPKTLENVELVFPAKDVDSIVTIKQCQIKRQEKNPQTQKYEYAIEFKEMTEAEEKKLTALFYKWQRDFLRKRRLLKA
jgi:c-di-GMP-binding flagellar brake protein YcgR